MDAALFFLLVFTAYTVLLALSLFRSRNFARQIDQLKRDVNEMRSVMITQGNVMHDMARQPNLVQQGTTSMAQVTELLSDPRVQQLLTNIDGEQLESIASNPLVQQAMQQSDDVQVQELQTLLSNPLVQQSMGNK